MSNDIVKKDENEELLLALIGDSGTTGLEDISSSDLKYPFINIAQPLTKKAQEGDPSYIEGLKPGYLFNSQTQFIYGSKLEMIVLHRFSSFRETMSGPDGKFVRTVPNEEFQKLFDSKKITQDGSSFIGLNSGNLIKENKNLLVILPKYPEHGVLRLSLTAGSFKYLRSWINMMASLRINGKQAPIWSNVWELTISRDVNANGKPFFSIGKENNATVRNAGSILKFMNEKDALSVKEAFQFIQDQKEKIATFNSDSVEEAESKVTSVSNGADVIF